MKPDDTTRSGRAVLAEDGAFVLLEHRPGNKWTSEVLRVSGGWRGQGMAVDWLRGLSLAEISEEWGYRPRPVPSRAMELA